jgi:putative intracellular protease/amidase
MKLSMVVFDGVTALDVVGGYEVLARLPGVELELVAKRRGVVAADTRRLGLTAYRALDEVSATDILYLPGGPGALALEADEAFLAKLRALDATSTWTVGICNGVGLLAAARLLEGRRATTNFFYRDRLRARGVEVVPERFHRDGKYVTGAGVSASLDTAFFLTSLLAGETVMKALALGLEYFPAPPYPERKPEEIGARIAELVRAAEETGAEGLRARPPFEAI